MAVNGIEIEVGQVWRTRAGEEVTVSGVNTSEMFPWTLTGGADEWANTVSVDGRTWPGRAHMDDLVELVSADPAKELPVQFAEQSANATQVGGDHYKTQVIQPWDFIASNGIGFLAGNVVKYVARYKAKNGMEDLKKARHYLDKLIETEGGAQ